MQKQLLAGAILALCAFACNKDIQTDEPLLQYPGFLDSAKAFFISSIQNSDSTNGVANIPAGAARSVQWQAASLVLWKGKQAVIAPLHYSKPLYIKTNLAGKARISLDQLSKLLLYKDPVAGWKAQVLISYPDSTWLQNPGRKFSGITVAEDWQGHKICQYLYTPSGLVGRYQEDENSQTINGNRLRVTSISSLMAVQVCYSMEGYNYSASDPDQVYEWSESLGCSEYYFLDNPGGDGGGYGSVSAPDGGGGSGQPADNNLTVVLAPPSNAISDINDYFKCFTSDPAASYQVTVCVNQPDPGTRTPWTLQPVAGSSGSNLFNVGHTFLVLTETSGNGTITRNIGLYPQSIPIPGVNSAVPAVLNDDENHTYDISGAFTLNNTMFFNILQYIKGGAAPGYMYNINTNNCTTFALNALGAGHIYLPYTYGYWLGGLGNDPGDLGEDIRTYNFTGMTRSTIPTAHANTGSCN